MSGEAWLPKLTVAASVLMLCAAGGCAARAPRVSADEEARRREAITRARVWSPTRVERMDLRTGPDGRRGFAPESTVDCEYVEADLGGNTPKFLCALPGGERVKVKFGATNGEVYAEVAATRLLWALGFGADYVYPVRVNCHGCPADGPGTQPPVASRMFDVAIVERRRPGASFTDDDGWSWSELEMVDPTRGGATRAQRDALKLLAALLQHTDSKHAQQRIVCDGPVRGGDCRRPFMFIDDVGRTFGRANDFNRDAPSSANLAAWSDVPVWIGDRGCRANLARSATGTLEHPVISEEGRRFLARLLGRLSDRQLTQLFTVARFSERRGAAAESREAVDAWVRAFKTKVAQIRARTCGLGADAS